MVFLSSPAAALKTFPLLSPLTIKIFLLFVSQTVLNLNIAKVSILQRHDGNLHIFTTHPRRWGPTLIYVDCGEKLSDCLFMPVLSCTHQFMNTNFKTSFLDISHLFGMTDNFLVDPSAVSKALRSINTVVHALLLDGPKMVISCRSVLFIEIRSFYSFRQGFLGFRFMWSLSMMR